MTTESWQVSCYKTHSIGVGVFGMEMKEAFSTNLADWLEMTGRKKSWVASQIGVVNSALTGWIEGRTMPAREDHFCKLAKLMELPDVSLLFLKGSIKQPQKAITDLVDKVNNS